MNYLRNILSCAEDWFYSYVDQFNQHDDDVKYAFNLKLVHTENVRNVCHNIAVSLDLPEHDVYLAEIIGLLHDVGRFSQYEKYHTFRDCLSEDHAYLSEKVISEQRFFSMLLEDDRKIISFAIKNHNKKCIESTCDDYIMLFARIIRDADKLDIYRIAEPLLTSADTEDISSSILEGLLNAKQCDYSLSKTMSDRKILLLIWIYDISFAYTLEKIKEYHYIEKICQKLPHNPKLQKGLERVSTYLQANIQ